MDDLLEYVANELKGLSDLVLKEQLVERQTRI